MRPSHVIPLKVEGAEITGQLFPRDPHFSDILKTLDVWVLQPTFRVVKLMILHIPECDTHCVYIVTFVV